MSVPELDLRALPAPEPLQRAIAAAEALEPGESLAVLTPLLPLPLLDMLEASGFEADAQWLNAGGARVLIRRLPRQESVADGATHA